MALVPIARGAPATPLPSAVDLTAAPDRENEDNQNPVVDLVDDPVGARPHTPRTAPAHERRGSCRAGLLCEQLDDRLDPPSGVTIQLAQLPRRPG